MVTAHLHCLHGSLQGPEVWDPLREEIERPGPVSMRVIAEDVLALAAHASSLETWAAAFSERTEGGTAAGPRILLGYSLGGRLALHALLVRPATWDAAVIVSAHPGGGDREELHRIRERDAKWAERFETEPAADVLRDWDASPVFGGRANAAPRRVADFDSIGWARAFRLFSRADQRDLLPALASAALPPVLCVAGAADPAYAEVALRLARAVPTATARLVAGAGHRVPWERPAAFVGVVQEFVAARCPPASPGAHG